MKKNRKIFFILQLVSILIFQISCDKNSVGSENVDASGIVKCKTNWKNAGIVSKGDGSSHTDLCKYRDKLFTSNVRGELFVATYPELKWTKIKVPCPSDDHLYSLVMDTTRGCLYLGTRLAGVYEYNIISNSWEKLTPDSSDWFDSTKYVDEAKTELFIRGYELIKHNGQLYFLITQSWDEYYQVGNVTANDSYSFAHIYSFNITNETWSRADSSWLIGYPNKSSKNTITKFCSVGGNLYATSYEKGIWVYENEEKWHKVGGTFNVFADDYDGKIGPGIHPRGMFEHEGDIYATNLGGETYKLLSDEYWEHTGGVIQIVEKSDGEWLVDTSRAGLILSLVSHNGFLLDGDHYYDSANKLWQYALPGYEPLHPRYARPLAATITGMETFGDTLFASTASSEDTLSGVYFLDLKKCDWFVDSTISE